MDLQTVLAAVDLEAKRAVADDVAGVPSGLTDLGWTAAPVIGDRGVVDRVWNHEACDAMCRAQTGFDEDKFYIGLIANFLDDEDTEAGVLHGQIFDLIQPLLLAAGFIVTGPAKSPVLWSDGQTAVDLALLRRIPQRTHTVPSAVQFAIYPLELATQPGPGPDDRAPRVATAGTRGIF